VDVVGRTALEIAAAVRRRSVSAEEVVAAHLDQVARLNPGIRAFQLVRGEKALAEARALDARADLADLPLAGVPVAIKDSVDVEGEPTRMGTLASPETPAPRDDELVRRLRAAGCVVIGKSTLSELAIWPIGDTAFGVTRNPWKLERTSGGSSAGAGAALAGAMVPLAQGSDGGGSIRIPAAACGVFGIKPGSGLVPVAGGLSDHWHGLSEWGPMATAVRDAAVMLDVLAATDRFSKLGPPDRKLRVALSLRSPAAGTRAHRDVRLAVEDSAEALRQAGHTVVITDPPYPQSLPLMFFQRFLSGIALDVDSEQLPMDRLQRQTRSMVRVGRWLQRNRPVQEAPVARWKARATEWFKDFDVALMPSIARPAPRADSWIEQGWVKTAIEMTPFVPYTQAWNLASFPAASIPSGRFLDGMPIGTQVVAAAGREDIVMSVCMQLEDLRPWARHAPSALEPAPHLLGQEAW
jgi:amidase